MQPRTLGHAGHVAGSARAACLGLRTGSRQQMLSRAVSDSSRGISGSGIARRRYDSRAASPRRNGHARSAGASWETDAHLLQCPSLSTPSPFADGFVASSKLSRTARSGTSRKRNRSAASASTYASSSSETPTSGTSSISTTASQQLMQQPPRTKFVDEDFEIPEDLFSSLMEGARVAKSRGQHRVSLHERPSMTGRFWEVLVANS